MAQIRESIELLTKILFENGALKVKAETFRAAKFNGGEAVTALWKLLFELISYCEYGKIDEVTARACSELSAEELVVYVKREFQQRGYNSLHFASLPKDMSEGSRELLLAFGWLLGSEKIMDRFMIGCTALLEDDTVAMHLADDRSLSSSHDSRQGLQLSASLSKQEAASPCQRVEQLLAFNNKLRMSLRSLFSAQCERNLLKHKIHEATRGVNSPKSAAKHLSMLEVYLMRHPELLSKHMDLLEQDNERLRNLLRWKDSEGIFWKWMESVLEEKKAAVEMNGAEKDNRAEEAVVADYADRLESGHSNLRQAILKYESIVEHLERLCTDKIEEVSSEDMDTILKSIDRELNSQKARLADHVCRTEHYEFIEPRFVLDRKKVATGGATYTSVTDDDSTTASTSAMRDIEDEIAMLRRVASSLDGDVDALRSRYEEQLRQLAAERLRNAVCVPPLNRNLFDRHAD